MADLSGRIEKLQTVLTRLRAASLAPVVERISDDLAALRFHLSSAGSKPIVALLGGTGTGKSTLVNRLLQREVTATSFRRTFTAGPIAIGVGSAVPDGWLGVRHEAVSESPARGTPGQLLVVSLESPLTENLTLVDTPDLDGDQPVHHAQAERVFRWAGGVLFVVTPEKYQMTELPPYYRLAERYGLACWFVMNKAESREQVEDYRQQLPAGVRDRVFAVPRDDSVFAPPAEQSLEALRESLIRGQRSSAASGIAQRKQDLVGRVTDQLLTPLSRDRKRADELISALKAMSAPAASVDVNPVTRQLQKRMQERSVLYLMGPGRIVDRIRQAPALLAKLPRTTWDWVMGKPLPRGGAVGLHDNREVPDFAGILSDQLAILQSRTDDLLRSNDTAATWIARDEKTYQASQLPIAGAAGIANDELAQLRQWLQSRWNATPRDTRILQALLKVIPGGSKLTQWSEAAPYLLAIVVAAHHAIFGPVDLVILGGYSLTAWLTERLSNEVSAQTRKTNKRIAERFAELAQTQIDQTIGWIESQVARPREIAELSAATEALAEER